MLIMVPMLLFTFLSLPELPIKVLEIKRSTLLSFRCPSANLIYLINTNLMTSGLVYFIEQAA
jgi:hypothetical protein